MHQLIEPFKGQIIGINFPEPGQLRAAHLVDVTDEYLSFGLQGVPTLFHYSMRYVIQVQTGDFKVGLATNQVHLVVHVDHLMIAGGGVGAGIAF